MALDQYSTTSLATTREQIFSELFKRVKAATFASSINGVTGWAGSVRKYVDPDQILSWPFLAQFEGSIEGYEVEGHRIPAIRTLNTRLFCWARVDSGDAQEIGSKYLNLMTEAIEAALQPDTKGFGFPGLCTLGGLVQWCRIEGTILRFPGDTEPQAMVSIPVKILWP